MEEFDVAIIGGGPAGSTAATLLAQADRRVIVLEREKFPRFHIGESLLPCSMATFSRLGVQEKLRATFLEKFGGEIANAGGETSAKFYFKDGFRARNDRSYQVLRSDFDKLLLDHAAEAGAEVCEESAVEDAVFGENAVQLRVSRPDHSQRDLRARFVIDASGRNSFIGNKFLLKKNYPHLQKLAIFAHFEGVPREAGIDGTLIRMVRTAEGWFWLIPLRGDRTSIGFVLDSAEFKRSKLSPEEFFARAIAEQPVVSERIANGARISPVYSAADFSYRSAKLAGPRWLLAGDAAGFIDPVFSSGVFLAVLAGEKAADVLNEVLDHPSRQRRLFARYEKLLQRAMKVYLRFVEAWYRGTEFVEVFLAPTQLLQMPAAVNAVLAGKIGGAFAIRWRMELFYLTVRLQKRWALCPRLSFQPRPQRRAIPTEAVSI